MQLSVVIIVYADTFGYVDDIDHNNNHNIKSITRLKLSSPSSVLPEKL